MRIAVDAMGTDARPVPDIAGAVLAAQSNQDTIVLVGPQDIIKREIDRQQVKLPNIEVVHAEQVIAMDDHPAEAGKEKSESSMHVGMRLVRDGDCDGFVTMGNAGAAHAIATLFVLKSIPGIKRPALSAIFPINGSPVTFLDMGANADCRPEWLQQFALMGERFAANALKIPSPRVVLLSIGEEDGKGSQLVRDAHNLLQNAPMNYIGNMEPKDIVQGKADVVVSDGFVGNIFLKTFDASGRFINGIIKEELKRGVFSAIGGLLATSGFNRVHRRVDTSEVGGAPLLGVNGVVIIGHGGSNAVSVRNAILQAKIAVESGVIEAIEKDLMLVQEKD